MHRALLTPLAIVGLVLLTACSSTKTYIEIAKPQLSKEQQKLADEATNLYNKKSIQKENICEEFSKLQSDDKYNSWKLLSTMLKDYADMVPSMRRSAREAEAYYQNQLTPWYERKDSDGKYVVLPEEYFYKGEWVVIRDLEDFCSRTTLN